MSLFTDKGLFDNLFPTSSKQFEKFATDPNLIRMVTYIHPKYGQRTKIQLVSPKGTVLLGLEGRHNSIAFYLQNFWTPLKKTHQLMQIDWRDRPPTEMAVIRLGKYQHGTSKVDVYEVCDEIQS